jgi:hypothetical protein
MREDERLGPRQTSQRMGKSESSTPALLMSAFTGPDIWGVEKRGKGEREKEELSGVVVKRELQ